MNITPELMTKAKEAKSAKELLALAKEHGIELTAGEAEAYYTGLHPASGELSDDELDNVSGGGCGGGGGEEMPIREGFWKYEIRDYVRFNKYTDIEEIYEGTVVGVRVGYTNRVEHPEYCIEYYEADAFHDGGAVSYYSGYYPRKSWVEESQIIGIVAKRC